MAYIRGCKSAKLEWQIYWFHDDQNFHKTKFCTNKTNYYKFTQSLGREWILL